MIKSLFSLLVTDGVDGEDQELEMGIFDISRAHFMPYLTYESYVEIPEEDRETGDEWRVGTLNLSLYGTRDAAQNWAAEYTRALTTLGFEVGRASPCNFLHKKSNFFLQKKSTHFCRKTASCFFFWASIFWVSKKRTFPSRSKGTHSSLRETFPLR